MKRFSCVPSRAKGYNPDLRLHPKERRFLGGSSTLFRCACIRVHPRGALGTAWRAAHKEGSFPLSFGGHPPEIYQGGFPLMKSTLTRLAASATISILMLAGIFAGAPAQAGGSTHATCPNVFIQGISIGSMKYKPITI